MYFYIKKTEDNELYFSSTNPPVNTEGLVEITEEEYNKKMDELFEEIEKEAE